MIEIKSILRLMLAEVPRRSSIEGTLGRAKLSKVRPLLLGPGVNVPYATLHGFAVPALGVGRQGDTFPVGDCEGGEEGQLDTGWAAPLEPGLCGKRRRFRA